MFNPLDYRDHIDYCEYVYNKNNELNLGLTNPQEIQFLANKYFDEVCARRGEVDELIENDKLLQETFTKQAKMFKKFRPITKEETKSTEISTIEEQTEEELSEDINQSKHI
jgi:hypothetical protein